MTLKEKLEVIKMQRRALRIKEEMILDKHLGENEGQWYKVGEWDCSDSPFGYCIYNPLLDRALDNCIFCHQPHERK